MFCVDNYNRGKKVKEFIEMLNDFQILRNKIKKETENNLEKLKRDWVQILIEDMEVGADEFDIQESFREISKLQGYHKYLELI